jgi:hypothetical protein
MRAVIRPVARAAALLLVAPFLAFASALAPEHVHDAGAGHDHVTHRHTGLHAVDTHNADTTEIEHDVEHIVWLVGGILHEAPYRAAQPPPAIPARNEVVAATLHWSFTRFDDAAPAHGPPKRLELLRGPPALLV